MTPILFASNETNFTSNGIGRLADARRCEVTEERNGQYELLMEYPTNGALLSYLVAGNYIMATHDSSGKPQPFQIYNVSEPLNGFVEVRAWHISYALNAIILKPFTATSCAEAMSLLASKSINANPFSFWTDKSVSSAFALTVPKSVRAVLGGTEGSLLDVYGKGEYEFDMFTVKLHLNRGVDRGVQIRYGKNLVSLERELDASNIHNAVVPYWTDGETTVTLDHLVVKTGQTAGRAVALDLSDSWDEAPTTAELETKAQSIIDASESYELKENLKIDFVFLWQTEEYKHIANLERVNLCDTVHIIYTKRGINATAKVIKVVYDALRERYLEMELGEPRTSLYQQIQQDTVQTVTPMIPSRPAIQSAIDKATELISGGFGGYIKYKYLVDGTPSEMLIMDTASEATATYILRFNKNGIGFSDDGGATYRQSWTIDGVLNADFIQTGKISDASGLNFWDLVSGIFQTKKGTIGGFTIDSSGLKLGDFSDISVDSVEISPDGIFYYLHNTYSRIRIDGNGITYEKADNGSWTKIINLDIYLSAVDASPYLRISGLTNGGSDTSIARLGSEGPVEMVQVTPNLEVGYQTSIEGGTVLDSLYVRGDAHLGVPLSLYSGGTGQRDIASTIDATVASISTAGVSIDQQAWVRYGKMVSGYIKLVGTISGGGTVNGSIANGWYPATRASGTGYYGTRGFVGVINSRGDLSIRNTDSSSASPTASSALWISFCYICAD